ncbi:MAG: 30S ribosomal protein S18 [Acidobacteria bacterium]|nr:30S ribosomal protein S18 [Acidobacteriota bacterium]
MEANGKGSGRRFFYRRKKVCRFCEEKIVTVDYKDVDLLKQFVPERGRVMPRRISGTCSFHQRRLRRAVKRARVLALLPFVSDEF